MITFMDKHEIILLHLKEVFQRKIASELGISRNTAASHIREYDDLASKHYNQKDIS